MANVVIGTATINVKADTSNFRTAIGGLAGITRGAIGKLGGVLAGLGLGALAKDAISFGGTYRVQLDNASAAIHGLVENQTDAADLMARMTEMAIQTPFDLPGIQNATTRLLAYGESFGVTSENVLDWVSVVGDAAASVGKGPDAMLNVITAMGKISGQGRIMTRDMNQITANFPSLHPWEILSEMTGKTEQELRKLATKPGGLSGIVDTTAFLDQLKIAMEEMPGAAGAMERKMNTLGGAFEQFKDAMGVALANGLQPFFNSLIGLMKNPAIADGLGKLIAAFGDLASKAAEGLAPVLPVLITGLTGILTALEPLMPVFGMLADLFGQLLITVTPFIGQLAAMVANFLPSIMQLGEALLPIVGLLGELLVAAIAALLPMLEPLIPLVTQIAEMLGESLAAVLPTVIDAFGQLTIALAPVIEQLADQFVLVLEAILPLLPSLADLLLVLVEAIIPIIPPLVELSGVWLGLTVMILNIVVPALTKIIQVLTWVVDKLGWVVDKIAGWVNAVIGWFQKLYDRLVGHSIIPDLINGILEWFGKLTAPIEAIVKGIRDLVVNTWSGLTSIVSGIWNGVKTAITVPIQAAYDFVADKVRAIKNLVTGAIDAVKSIPGAGAVGGLLGKIPGLATGGIINSPTLAVLGERSRREAVIPLTNPGRAMQLMQQSGLDRLAAQMGASRGLTGPIVSMPGAVIQDATDADLVAQRTLVAIQASLAA